MDLPKEIDTQQRETATLAGGCFWCLDAIFRDTRGVHSVVSGYTGGATPSPTYRMVCEGNTGHAEAVKITFDPFRISYRQILDIFFAIHDPTTLNRQGADVGTQYRSEIFHHSSDQKEIALALIRELSSSNIWSGRKIVTALSAAGPFYPAEDYHQNYFTENGGQPYCQMVVRPKFEKFRKMFPERAGSSARA